MNKRFWPNFFSQYRVWKLSRDSLQGSKRSSDNYCGSYKINSLGPKWLLKTKIFLKKRQPFQWKKDFGQFFLGISIVKNLRERFIRVQKYFDKDCGSYKIISLGPNRFIENTIFWKKKSKLSTEKKYFGLLFLAISSVKNLREQFLRIKKVFWLLRWKLWDHFFRT